MALQHKAGANKGITDTSMHIGKTYTDTQKQEIIKESIADMFTQLQKNAENICTYNSDIWSDNLLADTLEGFLVRKIKAQWDIFMEGKLERYLTRAMSLAIRSNTSPFWHKYRKDMGRYRELFPERDYGEDPHRKSGEYKMLLDDVENEVDALNYYYKELIQRHYYNNETAEEIGKALNISTNTITTDIRKGLELLKNKLQTKFEQL